MCIFASHCYLLEILPSCFNSCQVREIFKDSIMEWNPLPYTKMFLLIIAVVINIFLHLKFLLNVTIEIYISSITTLLLWWRLLWTNWFLCSLACFTKMRELRKKERGRRGNRRIKIHEHITMATFVEKHKEIFLFYD